MTSTTSAILPSTQKAVVFRRYGPAEDVLTLDAAYPVPHPDSLGIDDVLVRVVASALNPVDKIRITGGMKALRPEAFKGASAPVLGYDASGIVAATGAGVEAFKTGDEVMVRVFSSQPGTTREYLVSNQHALAPKPAELSFEEAASMPLAGVTALQLLKKAGVKQGSKVFISGGAGGVGTIAIQLAKKVFGAAVVATTASEGAGTALCREMGADVIVDYKKDSFERVLAGQDFDVAIDTTHESVKMAAILKPAGGKVLTIADTPTVEALRAIGAKPGLIVRLVLNAKRNKAAEQAAKQRNGTWQYLFLDVNGKDLRELAEYALQGKIRPVIDHVYDLDRDWQAAVARAFGGRAKGKVVVRISNNAPAAANSDGDAESAAAAAAATEEEEEEEEEAKSSDDTEERPGILRGSLRKQSKWRKAWDPREITLRSPVGGTPFLASSAADGKRAHAHKWSLSASSTVQDNKAEPNAFTVVAANGERVHLAADNSADQRRWVKALRHAIGQTQ